MQTVSLSSLRAFIIDGSGYMSGLLAGLLRSAGLRIIEENGDPVTALAALNARPFDLVLVDADLRPLDGTTLTRRLRASSGKSRDAMVLMTFATISKRQLLAARDAGVTEFIQKPISGAALESRLRTCLALPRDFVEAPGYVGPDRRRRRIGRSAPERRSADTADASGTDGD